MKSTNVLTNDESERMLIGIAYPRERLMFLLMLDAGLRVGELVQLKLSDLLINDHPVFSLTVRPEIAKNHTAREIPLSSRVYEAINNLKNCYWRPLYYEPENFAFPAPPTVAHISTRQVERIIKNIAERTILRPITPHTLRHTFATRLMRKTSTRVVQQLLGHKNLSSTQIYTHPNSEDLRLAIDSMEEKHA